MARLSDYTTVTGGNHEALAETLNSVFSHYQGNDMEDIAARKAALSHLGFPEADISTLEANYAVICENRDSQYDDRQDTPFTHDQDLLGDNPQLTADTDINHDLPHVMGAISVGDEAKKEMSGPSQEHGVGEDKPGRTDPTAASIGSSAGDATVETSVATSAPERRSEISKVTVNEIVSAGAGSVRAQSKETRAKTYAADVADMGEQFSNMKERESAARKRMEELHKAQREEDAKNSKDGMKYGMAGAGAIFALMEGAASLAMVGPILGPVLIAVAVVGLLKFGYEATKVASSKLEQYQDKQELKDHFKQEKASLKDLSEALTSSRNADNEVVDKTMSDGVMNRVAEQEGVAPGAEDIGEVVGARLAQTTGIQRAPRHERADSVSRLRSDADSSVKGLNDVRVASGPDQRGAGKQALQEQVLSS